MAVVMQYIMYVVCAVIFGYIFWSVYKDIKDADTEERGRKYLIYGGILSVCFIVYMALRTYAAEPLAKVYEFLSGIS